MKTKFRDVLADIRAEVLVEFSGRACLVDYNPAARWLGRCLAAELNRRNGEPAAAIESLQLDQAEADFACEWLDSTASVYAVAALEAHDGDLLRLAALLHHLLGLLTASRPASLH